ncbi:hypothetical protein WFP14_08540 [Yersinia proxima]|uniref:Uncharacterized protein n=1 Tax=Yersinia proxima TaxID=2890316 RepID=A0ABW9EXZ0_9GAMM
MNNIEELREHCEEMIAISRMQYAYIPASSIITLIDRIEKAEKESKQWYSVVEAAISDDAEWRKQSNTASEAIGYLTTGIVMLKERAEKAEAALSAANEKLSKPVVLPRMHVGFDGVSTNAGDSVRNKAISDCAETIRVAGFTVEGDTNPIVIVPAPAGVVMRPQFEKPLERCAAARDGECHHKDCPQLRDNEPMATGRHCPIDNWDDE